MAESVVSSAIHGLGGLLASEANSLWGLADKIKQLQNQLRRLQCFLRDADAKQTDSAAVVSEWIAEIRECAYDAEDVIHHFKGKKEVKLISIRLVRLHKVGNRIESIRARITSLSADLQVLGIKQIDPREGNTALVDSDGGTKHWTYPHSEEASIVGLDLHIERVVEQLLDEAKSCSVVSICGMGGVGKTALARKVYWEPQIRQRFGCFAWAYVSQGRQAREVLEGILIELTSPTAQKRRAIVDKRVEEIVKDLHRLQQRRRCLVVLDGLTTAEAWNGVAEAFPRGRSGSKVLLTSSNKHVCLQANPQGYIHELGCLSEENSWKLLRILSSSDEGVQVDKQMESIGRQIAPYCGGLPLALVAIGKILATKRTLDEWKTVRENVKTYLRNGEGVGQGKTSVRSILSRSYKEVPYQLKPCFLYLGNFPENHKIQARSLLWMWEAEEFLCGEDRQARIEDVADRYLNELEKRHMIRLRMDEETGRIQSCELHNLMHDLCVFEAEKENFLRVMDLQGEGPTISPPIVSTSSSSTTRDHRLSIRLMEAKGHVKISRQYKGVHHVRTLIILIHKHCGPEYNLVLPLKSFKSLRVLHLEGSKWSPGLPDEIGELLSLTYLGLKFDQLEKLPHSIGRLSHLQTLNIQVGKVYSIPNVLWKLKQLRHLHLPHTYHQVYGDPLPWTLGSCLANRPEHLRLNTLISLETLHNLKSLTSIDDCLPLPNKLYELSVEIHRLQDVPGILNFLNSSSHLRRVSLSIRGEIGTHNYTQEIKLLWLPNHLHELEIRTSMRELPRSNMMSTSLSKLLLWNSRLTEDPMIELEKLPNLRTLSLRFNSFLGEKMICSDSGFRQLRVLDLRELSNLEEWTIEDGAICCLQSLKVMGCAQLRMIPDGLKFVTTIRELKIIEMPAKFQKRLMEADDEGRGGEDLYKVKHIASLSFVDDY